MAIPGGFQAAVVHVAMLWYSARESTKVRSWQQCHAPLGAP